MYLEIINKIAMLAYTDFAKMYFGSILMCVLIWIVKLISKTRENVF